MNYSVRRNVYKTPEGVVTHDAGEGANTLVYARGAVVSDEKAKELKLRELDLQSETSDAAKPFDADLKPAEIKEVSADKSAKGTKSKAPTAPTGGQEVK